MLAVLIRFGREEGLVYIVAAVVPLVIVAGFATPFVRQHWKLALYAILLMTGFNFFSHGTQDLYPTFLRVQHHFDDATVTFITVVLNLGAIVGGLTFASFSQSFGRRKTVILVALLALPVIYFWASAQTAMMLALGAFLMQICVQGAWGVVPVHLNELSPRDVRGTFAGTVYQLGNLIASVNAVFQAELAESGKQLLGLQHYSLALAVVACFAALLIATMMYLGPEAKNADMGRAGRPRPNNQEGDAIPDATSGWNFLAVRGCVVAVGGYRRSGSAAGGHPHHRHPCPSVRLPPAAGCALCGLARMGQGEERRGATPRPTAPLRCRWNIVGAIELEASPWIEDNLWVLEQEHTDPLFVGTVGDLEPEKPDFADQFNRFRKDPLFLGIRCGNIWNRDVDKQVTDPKFIDGLKRVADAGLVMDSANPTVGLMQTMVRINDKIPGLRIMIDHLPQLDPKPEEEAGYKAVLKGKSTWPGYPTSSTCQAVGDRSPHHMPAAGLAAHKARLDQPMDAFGEDRVVFGSNWPNSWGTATPAQIVSIARRWPISRDAQARRGVEKYFLEEIR